MHSYVKLIKINSYDISILLDIFQYLSDHPENMMFILTKKMKIIPPHPISSASPRSHSYRAMFRGRRSAAPPAALESPTAAPHRKLERHGGAGTVDLRRHRKTERFNGI